MSNRSPSLTIIIGLLALTMLACNAFTGAATLPPPPTPGTLAAEATDVLAPTVTIPGTAVSDTTPDPDATATDTRPLVQARVDLNVRTGPGVVYDRDGFLLEEETAVVLGRAADTEWWRIECPPRSEGPACWVSGRAQYTIASNTGGVPIAEAPPTPTPEPEDVGTAVAYISNGRLFLQPLDLSGDLPVAAGERRQLGERDDVQFAAFSPDGRQIAYVAGAQPDNALRLINGDGSDDRELVAAATLSITADLDPADYAPTIDVVKWLPDGSALAFNTRAVNQSGFGAISQLDLWLVAPDGTLSQSFAAGSGGGDFFPGPGEQVILSRARSIARGDINGANSETMISFPLVNTASEYFYFPQAQWTGDGARAYVAIPGETPFAAGAEAALWQIPASGAAGQIGTLEGNILFHPVAWTSDGGRLAYVRQLMTESQPAPSLMLAAGNGSSPAVYANADQLTFHAWQADASHFLYNTEASLGIGQPGASPVTAPLTEDEQVAMARWVSDSGYIAMIGDYESGRWTLLAGNLAGETAEITAVAGARPRFAVWTPQPANAAP